MPNKRAKPHRREDFKDGSSETQKEGCLVWTVGPLKKTTTASFGFPFRPHQKQYQPCFKVGPPNGLWFP